MSTPLEKPLLSNQFNDEHDEVSLSSVTTVALESNENHSTDIVSNSKIRWKSLLVYHVSLFVLGAVSLTLSLNMLLGCQFLRVDWSLMHESYTLTHFGIFNYKLDSDDSCHPYKAHVQSTYDAEDIVGNFLRENPVERLIAFTAIFFSIATFLSHFITTSCIFYTLASKRKVTNLEKVRNCWFPKISAYSKLLGCTCHFLTLLMLRHPKQDKNGRQPIACDNLHSTCHLGKNGFASVIAGTLYFTGFLLQLYIENVKGYSKSFSKESKSYRKPQDTENSLTNETVDSIATP